MTARQRLALDTEVRLRDFASLLATAISNARAHERITRLADEQAALRRIATLVAEGATPNRVFEAVRHEIARTFDLPITVLMRYDADGMATMVGDPRRLDPTRWEPLASQQPRHERRRTRLLDGSSRAHPRSPCGRAGADC